MKTKQKNDGEKISSVIAVIYRVMIVLDCGHMIEFLSNDPKEYSKIPARIICSRCSYRAEDNAQPPS